ncbi:PerC family transcriptional regulator [Escherichia coli]|uniref:PerC family transcriptional regulator n=1 Tax=Escherichia coli TaxID=562 RepID=UPI003340B53F
MKTITYLSDIGCLEIQGASLRGLWRRAAARWQELLLNYLQEDDRICIQRRIQHCLKRAKMKSQRATSQEEFSCNDSNLLIVFYVQIMPDDFVMQLHRF